MSKKRFLALFLVTVMLVACGAAEPTTPSFSLIDPTPTLLPTPTLVPALAEAMALATAVAPTPALNLARPKPTLTPTPTPSPTPGPTPLPQERLASSSAALHNGNAPAAIGELQAALRQRFDLTDTQEAAVLLDLGRAYLQEGQPAAAIGVLNELLALPQISAPSEAYFFLAQAHAALGEHQAAIAAYQQYLELNPEMATYVSPFMAEAYFALGERQAGIAAYERALSGAGFRLAQIELREKLAAFYLSNGAYDAAIAQYDAIRELAVTEATKGRMTYLAGQAQMAAGRANEAYGRFLFAVNNFPRAYESYLGLIVLVEAGVPVNEFQRGLVNYHARSFLPGIAAFERYLAANPTDYRADTHLYLAWCYEGAGNVEAALAQLAQYATTDGAVATIERAKLLARAGNGPAALAAYDDYLANYPAGNDAAFAAWWSAWWLNALGDRPGAQARYRFFADSFPAHEDAPEALFRVGLLAEERGDLATAVATWLELNERYPGSHYSGATLVWLLRTLPQLDDSFAATLPITPTAVLTNTMPFTSTAVLRQQVQTLALANPGTGYYALRARELAQGVAPFTPSGITALPPETAVAQQEAEAWLRDWLNLGEEVAVSQLSPMLANDPRIVVGSKLWRLGLQEAAKRELEAVRQEYATNALLSFQLALYFRDLGLYRSSILAAEAVLLRSGQSIFSAPRFLGRLIYPVYYADLILPLAAQYGYDPLLQFALVRQESLFESFATSTAVAQGLSQVIPATGAYIAQKLAWPNYENADLYKPYVGLAFGAYYLQEQLGLFNGFVSAALAAYNAGPGNALRWYNLAGPDHDLYVETVNFAETRLYIERIYSGHLFYRYLYGARE